MSRCRRREARTRAGPCRIGAGANNIQRYGSTTAGTIPIALCEARQAGHAQPGDLVCFVGLGSVLNWGAVLYRF